MRKHSIATGFNRLGPWDDEPADPEVDRFDQLDDVVSTTSQVFLGVTLGCARCHNHKFDPLTARDYYSMVAIFNGLQRPRNGRTELDLPVGTPDELEREAARDRKIDPLKKQIAEVRERHSAGHSSMRARARCRLMSCKRSELNPRNRTDDQKALVTKHAKELDQEVACFMPADLRSSIENLEERIRALRR